MSNSGFTSRNLNYNPQGQLDSLLSPRTPHSRASGRPKTTFHDDDEEDEYVDRDIRGMNADADEVDMLHVQAQEYPLLRSSASASFPMGPEQYAQVNRSPGIPSSRRNCSPRSARYMRTDAKSMDGKLKTIVDTAPLVLGSLGVCILLVLIIISYKRPDVLQSYILKNSTATPPPSQLENSKEQQDTGLRIDYSNHTVFPLEPIEYEEECWRLQAKGGMAHGNYWGDMKSGSANMQMLDVPHEHAPGEQGVCSSTVTYVLDGNVGLFFDLALVAQTAALARERNRTFIIDDSKWNRGEWTDHFMDVRITQPGPEPGCLPPPPNELVACPRTARHWVVTQRTAKFHFGHDFADTYEDPYKSDMTRQKPIYDHAAMSFKETIRPSDSLRQEITELRRRHATKPYIGVHIRHGDRYPLSQKWHGDYVPTMEYIKATQEAWKKLRVGRTPEVHDVNPNVYVATDSYAAYEDHLALFPAPENVWGLHAADNQDGEERKWRWMASPQGYIQRVFMGKKTRTEARVRWTKGMVLDFAMLTGAWLAEGEQGPKAVVCTLTSNVCKMAAVILGWERSFERKLWIDVDWQGDVWPPWDAFEFH